MRFHFEIVVELKEGLLDPQGKAIEDALPTLGFSNVSNVRVGKIIELDVDAASGDEAATQAEEMGERLLANPVIETIRYSYRAEEGRHVSAGMGASSKIEIERG